MTVRVLFGCEHCDARPDADPQRTLRAEVQRELDGLAPPEPQP
jgi:hypothetical protein